MSENFSSSFLRTLSGEIVYPRPIWLMRQAGRYLPEYRATREQAGGFLDLCYNSELAAEVTLQPIRRFHFDAAILFADILLIPHALGQDVQFQKGEGPVLDPIKNLDILDINRVETHLAPVGETLRRLKRDLPPETALIGFAGAPWTVATYMIEGQGSKDHLATRACAYQYPIFFAELLHLLSEATLRYLTMQVEAGAQAVQIFDSWAGSATADGFDNWVIEPTRVIVEGLRERFPDLPIIGFARGAGEKLAAYAQGTGVDCVGLDYSLNPKWVDDHLPEGLCVQGNLDPALLIAGGVAMEAAVHNILKAFKNRPHIFNLGHGIVPQTPIEHVVHLIKLVRDYAG